MIYDPYEFCLQQEPLSQENVERDIEVIENPTKQDLQQLNEQVNEVLKEN